MDNYKNFATAIVSGGYNSSAVNITLVAGEIANLPPTPFNAVWYNYTDYINATTDPNKEIIRVTGMSSNDLIVTRAQEGTTATAKNVSNKTYMVFAPLTAYSVNELKTGYLALTGSTMRGTISVSGSGFLSIDDRNGDDITSFSSNNTNPLKYGISLGTSTGPVTTVGPLVKISKWENMPVSQMTNGATNEQTALVTLMAKNTTGSEAQCAGLWSSTHTRSISEADGANRDACAIIGIGRQIFSGLGRGIGGYFEGRRDDSSGKAAGLEIRSSNYGLDVNYNTSAASETLGLWVTCGGTSGITNGAAIQIGSVSTCQWDVGIGAVSLNSPIKNTFIRDDSSAGNSIMVIGARTGAAFVAGAGAGHVLIGSSTRNNTSSLLEVTKTGSSDPLVAFHGGNSISNMSFRMSNATTSYKLFIVGTPNGFSNGTVVGDGGILCSSLGNKFSLAGASGAIISVRQTGLSTQLSFFGKTPTGLHDNFADLKQCLVNFGLISGGGSTPLNLNSGVLTASIVQSSSGTTTNQTGENLYVRAGASCGTGWAGNLVLQTSLTGNSSNIVNPFITRQFISSKPTLLTESSATTFATINLNNSKYIGGTIMGTIFASDGTDHQCQTSSFSFSAINKGGTITAQVSPSFGSGLAASLGSINTEWTAVANGNNVDLKCSAVSTLTQNKLDLTWQLNLNSNDEIIITPL